jgi:hypothetical protein
MPRSTPGGMAGRNAEARAPLQLKDRHRDSTCDWTGRSLTWCATHHAVMMSHGLIDNVTHM